MRDTIDMARKVYGAHTEWTESQLERLRRFEALVRADEQALAAPVQEHAEQLVKLGWQYFECPACGSEGARAFPKPAAQRQWVGLTDEEIDKLKHLIDWTATWSHGRFAYEIEQLLKEKNA